MRQLKGRKKLRSISSESMPNQLHAEKGLPMLPKPKLQNDPRHMQRVQKNPFVSALKSGNLQRQKLLL